MLVVALCLLAVPLPATPAEAATLEPAAAGQGAPVVPILFPLEKRISWVDTFGAARSGGRTHAGNDLMADKMTPLLAVVDGKLDWLNLTGKLSSYNNLPYYNILLRGDDGNDYFYVHINNDTPGTDDGKGGVEFAYAPGLSNGMQVKRGQVIAYVGDSGNAEDTAPHLHFEIHLGGYVSASGGQTRSPSAIDPYNSLKAAPTLAEWTAAGKPPITVPTTVPGATTTTTKSTTTTTKPPTTTTTTAKPPTTTTTTKPTTSSTAFRTTTTTAPKVTTTTLPGAAVAGFSDVRTSDWFYRDFAGALAADIVVPDPDNRFRPYSLVSRALFATYLVRTMAPDELAALGDAAPAATTTTTTAVGDWGGADGGGTGETGDAGGPGEGGAPPVEDIFADVPASHWAYDEIELAARLGLVRGTGDGGSFSPDALVTRAQMATMLCRALGAEPGDEGAGGGSPACLLYKDISEDYWAGGAIVTVHTYGLMYGDANKCFRPVENTNRAQAVTVMARLLRLLQGEAGS
jgi:hypothetical protein